MSKFNVMSKSVWALALLLFGCGTTTGGGGPSLGGGNVAGTSCNVAVAEGCLLVLGGSQRMQCVNGKWALLEVCSLGTACEETMTAGVAAHVTHCAGAGDAAGDATSTPDTADAATGPGADGELKDAENGKDTSDSGTFATPDGAGTDGYSYPDGYAYPDADYGYDAYVPWDGYSPADASPYDGYSGYDTWYDYDASYPYDTYYPYDSSYPYDAGSYDAWYDYDTIYDYDSYSYDAGYTYDTSSGDAGSDPCYYDKPMSWPGCTSPTDASYIAALLPGTLAYDNFANIVSDCTLKMGCLAVGTQCMAAGGQDIAQGKCISDCIVQQTGWLLSDNCAWCFGEFAGVCAFKSCLSDCAVNAAGPACTSCLATNCDPQANGCKAGN